ncbi:MAG: alpha/beta hydrolase, partial [Candidatus Neomarinimicrobiota bacterium]
GITTYSFLWEPVLSELTDYAALAIDLPGCGQSTLSIEHPYSIRQHTDTMIELLDLLDVPAVHWVGHDIGGGILQRLAVLHPERIRSLTLINPIGFDYWPVQPIKSLQAPVIRQLLMGALDTSLYTFIIRRGFFDSNLLTDDLMEKFRQPLLTAEGRKAFLHFAQCLDNQELMDIAPRLPEYTKPALLIRGDADVYLTATIIDRLHDCWPQSRLIRIVDGGHFLPLEKPEIIAKGIGELMNHDT